MNVIDAAENIAEMFSSRKKVVVIVQCRLSSTRLPGKALLPLGGKTVLEWTLASMKKVRADSYWLAVDEESKSELEKIAEKAGWKIFAGSQKDVLDRFCRTIELSGADIVVRGTADNPFLFYDAANDLLSEFFEYEETTPVDYITYSGLPHGSGIEIFNAHSLLNARDNTNLDYDHEHVGPSLYNHTDKFRCLFLPAPKKYNHPQLRSTIDTSMDYRRALAVVDYVSGKESVSEPYSTEKILEALSVPSVSVPVILVPCVKKGRGTGHLRRCLKLAIENRWDIYISPDSELTQCSVLIGEAIGKGLCTYQLVHSFDAIRNYSYAVTDLFVSDSEIAEKISSCCPVIALDDGSENLGHAEYVLDILPSATPNRNVNMSQPAFIPLPKNRRPSGCAGIHHAIVVLGGEDPSELTLPAAIALSSIDVYTTVIVPDEEKIISMRNSIPEKNLEYIKFSLPVENLSEKLFEYDMVVTHYGFTAFEASAAGCAVLLLATSSLHKSLSDAYGFCCLLSSEISSSKFRELIENRKALFVQPPESSEENSLGEYLKKITLGKHFNCPVCRAEKFSSNPVVARIRNRTFRRCSKCGMVYISWTAEEKQTEYNRAYFFEDYEKQYGKTYLEDFASIKSQCVRRVSIIDFLYRGTHRSVSPVILDVGCAMGPFLDAANDSGWQVCGIDVSKDAVDYVQNTLKYPAAVAAFPCDDLPQEFGVDKFDALTMWYVIEHFQNLDSVLSAVSSLVKKGGVFAFSTPSGSGVSARYNRKKFFEESPSDHYSIWEINNAASILKKYGFKILRIVPTGIHPERFPVAKKFGWKEKSFQMMLLKSIAGIFKLGDTFEVYCRKVK